MIIFNFCVEFSEVNISLWSKKLEEEQSFRLRRRNLRDTSYDVYCLCPGVYYCKLLMRKIQLILLLNLKVLMICRFCIQTSRHDVYAPECPTENYWC